MGERNGDGADRAYGDGDATFQALGGEVGIRALVEEFYRQMDSLPEAAGIRALHASDLSESIEKLICFLCGWTGGPKRYAQVYRPIKIPQVHIHLPIAAAERDAWLLCMERALMAQPIAESLRRYMIKELFRPAEKIRSVIEARAQSKTHTFAD